MDESLDLRERLDAALDRLGPRERHVLLLRFGFDRGHERTLREEADDLGLSRERVRQVEATALRLLRTDPVLRLSLDEFLA